MSGFFECLIVLMQIFSFFTGENFSQYTKTYLRQKALKKIVYVLELKVNAGDGDEIYEAVNNVTASWIFSGTSIL